MINLKELRIGNRVNINGSQYELDAYDFVDYVCDDFDPIPLTPEILEKCGFVNKPTGNYKLSYERIEDEFSNFRTWWYRGDIYIEPIGDDKGYISIKYLHQLQNLYFALTGKELVEIKELQEN